MGHDRHAGDVAGKRPDRMLVVCDDLTGAGAYAAGLADVGVAAHVMLAVEEFADPVTVIDLETRDLEPDAAAARAAHAITALAGRDRQIRVVRRVDTTLRGAIAEELSVALAAGGCDRLVLAPAYPTAGRTTIAGSQRLPGGAALEITRFVPSDLRPVVGGDEPPAAGECWIPDIVDQASLQRVAEAIADQGAESRGTLLADAGPVGAALAARTLVAFAPRILVVVGSSTDLVQRQLTALAAIGADADVLATPLGGPGDPRFGQFVGEARAALETGGYGAVILCGGLTAGAVLRSIGLRHLAPVGLVAPLVSLLRGWGPGGPLLIALKGGQVGEDGALVATVEHLRARLASRRNE